MAEATVSGQGKSLAMWFPRSANRDAQPSVELHFNLWRMGHHGQKSDGILARDMLDVGIMVKDPNGLDSICLYLPTKIDASNIEDLSLRFVGHVLPTGVFNESLTGSSGHDGSLVKIHRLSGEPYCSIFNFPTSNGSISSSYIVVKQDLDGSVITIGLEALKLGCSGLAAGENLYFRLRIAMPENSSGIFFSSTSPSNKWLTSSIDVVEHMDFRLNQNRTLNPGIPQYLVDQDSPNYVPVKRLDFLLVVGVAVDLVIGHRDFHKCRLLETDLWKSYASEAHLKKGMVIYHWKEMNGGKPIKDFNAFVKLRVKLSGWQIIKSYLIIALIFGAICGASGNLVYDLIKSALKADGHELSQSAARCHDAPGAMGSLSASELDRKVGAPPQARKSNEPTTKDGRLEPPNSGNMMTTTVGGGAQ